MPFTARARVVNPRLGTYFSIFASLFTALFLLTLIFSQLNVSDGALRYLFLGAALVLFAVIGGVVATNETLAYFASGRRVPSVYSGLVLGLSGLGSTFVVAGTGVFFFAGFDALVLLVGVLSGFVIMAVVLAPFYRKFGAFTVPTYLGRRFDSRAIRYVAAIVSVTVLTMVLAAELRIGAGVVARLTGISPGLVLACLAVFSALTIAPGGQRSATWMAVAQAIAFLLALMTVATMISMVVTSLPVPQLANGPIVRGLVRHEGLEGLASITVWPLAFDWPGQDLLALSKPYTRAFGTVGTLAFILAAISVATGLAAAPWLLPRVASAPGIYEARKSLGWSTVFAGLVLLTTSSVAIFMRDFVLDAVREDRIGPIPAWLNALAAQGLARFDPALARVDFTDLFFLRDGVLFAVPTAAGLPVVFSYLMLVGAASIALMAINTTMAALANVISEDVAQGMSWEPRVEAARVWMARILIAVAAMFGVAAAFLVAMDPLKMVMAALCLTGAVLFPIMVLSIWWKSVTRLGALVGLVAGIITCVVLIEAGLSQSIGIPMEAAGALTMPVTAAVAMVVSLLRPEVNRHALEIVRDIRIPGGDIIYDREMQRMYLKSHARS